MSRVFDSFAIRSGLIQQLTTFPTDVYGWSDPLECQAPGTYFGYVFDGRSRLKCESGEFELRTGMYFAVPNGLQISGGTGLLIHAQHHHGFFHLGGPIELTGRLRYIDGCTDSLLIPPIIMGDPCLNLLHLPAGTRQTPHTHPSFRIGLILSGEGECVTPTERIALKPGLAFTIAEEGRHCFHTSHQSLLVLAYHPDSDCGPTHENHPMINRTIIGQ